MKDQKEIRIALEIWNLINKLSDLLWDRYEEGFLQIYLKEEEDKILRTLEAPDLPSAEEKTSASR
ncbi:MAG: hypothetical protein QME90_12520 [Thermodesulfobacteriota bacterium]|nr:hypothetical protein [Thermodesulfobacteriota bacterium]